MNLSRLLGVAVTASLTVALLVVAGLLTPARAGARVLAPPTAAQELARVASAAKSTTPASPLARVASAAKSTTPAPPQAQGPLVWSVPHGIDANPINALDCPSASLCFAIDSRGHILTSATPTKGTGKWQSVDVDGSTNLTSLSCPSAAMCVAVDQAGNAVTSLAPTGPATAWAVAHVDSSIVEPSAFGGGPTLLRDVSCPSVSLCLAVDSVGNAVYSTDPTAGPTAWVLTHIDDNSTSGCAGGGLACQAPLMSVACPGASLCAAADFAGNLLETSSLSAAPWSSSPTPAAGPQSLWSISCPVVSFCAAVDGTGGHVMTWNPQAGSAPRLERVSFDAFGIWCPTASLCLASGQGPGGVAEVVGSTNPRAASPTWHVSDFGDFNSISCPTASLCLAADTEGEVITGVTVSSLAAGLRAEMAARIPKVKDLTRDGAYNLSIATPLSGKLTVEWEVPGAVAGATGPLAKQPVVLASGSARFAGPGTQTLRLVLTEAGRRVLKQHKRLSLTATATYETNTGAVSASRKLTLRSGR